MFKFRGGMSEAVTDIIISIIGDTVKDRVLRSTLVIIIAIGSQLLLAPKDPQQCSVPVKSGMQKIKTPQ